jgi:hypothetical protein
MQICEKLRHRWPKHRQSVAARKPSRPADWQEVAHSGDLKLLVAEVSDELEMAPRAET